MKSIKWIAVFLALLVCLSGCAGTHQSGGSYNIYLIAKSSTTEFWKSVFAGANAAKSEYNVQLTILAPDTEEDFEVQNDYIRQAVADGADAIVFSAISYTENAAAIDEAVAAGVRVVVIDSDVDSKGVSVRIGTDNVAAGRMSGEAALKTAQEKIVVGIVNAYAETQNCREREQGFREVLLGDSRVKGIYAVNVSTDALEARLAAEYLMNGGENNVFNLGNGVGFTVKEIIDTAEKVVGKPIKCEMAPRRAGDPAQLVASSEKAKTVLGWKPKYDDIETIIGSAWNWHKEHPHGYDD